MSLVSVNQLASVLHDPQLRIVDARFVLADAHAGLRSYHAAHVPGAVFVDLNADLSAEKTDPRLGRHPLPDAVQFSRSLSRLGIAPDTKIVVYDQADAAMAASRFWFLMHLAGHRNISVLDGGLDAWLAAGLPVDSVLPNPAPSAYPVCYRYQLLVAADELKALLGKPGTVLLDARAPERFRGEVEPLDAKAGHIPGALNRPFQHNLIAGKFKPAEQLRAEFAPLIEGKTDIVLSCGSGVTACHNALALSLAGIENWRLFAPSWSGWLADDGNPVAVGD